MGFEPKTLDTHGTHAYPLSHHGHKEPWTRWIYILKVKCEVIKETVSARKDQPSMGFEPKNLNAHGTRAYPLSHQGHKDSWTRWNYILKVKWEVIKDTISARKDRCSLPWGLNPQPLSVRVHVLIHWAIRDTSIYELVENTSLRLSVRSLKRPFLQGKTNAAYHGIWTQEP